MNIVFLLSILTHFLLCAIIIQYYSTMCSINYIHSVKCCKMNSSNAPVHLRKAKSQLKEQSHNIPYHKPCKLSSMRLLLVLLGAALNKDFTYGAKVETSRCKSFLRCHPLLLRGGLKIGNFLPCKCAPILEKKKRVCTVLNGVLCNAAPSIGICNNRLLKTLLLPLPPRRRPVDATEIRPLFSQCCV